MSGNNPACAFGCNTAGAFGPYWVSEPIVQSFETGHDPDTLREIVKDAVREVLAEKWAAIMEDTLTRYEDAWRRLAKE